MQPFSLYQWMMGGEPTAKLTVRLYSARTTPIPSQPTVGDFTECVYGGYQRIAFPPDTATVYRADGTGVLAFPALLWTWGPAGPVQTVAGAVYVATRTDGSEVVIGFEDFPSPQPMTQRGDDIVAQLVITAQPLVITVP